MKHIRTKINPLASGNEPFLHEGGVYAAYSRVSARPPDFHDMRKSPISELKTASSIPGKN